MTRHRAIVTSAAALAAALSLWIGWPTDEAIDSGQASTPPLIAPAGSPASLERPMQATPSAPTAPEQVAVPLSAPPSATTAAAVPVAVTAPQKVLVGEMNELVVSVGANAGFSEIGFTVQFDPNVLQVRAGTQGGWGVAVGVNPRFSAEISSGEDRVQVRSALPGQRAGLAGGSVAIVQFQAISTGSTSVLITDVVIKDATGSSMRPALSASNLQISAESLPPSPAAPRPQDDSQR